MHWTRHPSLHWNCHLYYVLRFSRHCYRLPDFLFCCLHLSALLKRHKGIHVCWYLITKLSKVICCFTIWKCESVFSESREKREGPQGDKSAGVHSLGGKAVTDTQTQWQLGTHPACGLTFGVNGWACPSAPFTLPACLSAPGILGAFLCHVPKLIWPFTRGKATHVRVYHNLFCHYLVNCRFDNFHCHNDLHFYNPWEFIFSCVGIPITKSISARENAESKDFLL